MSDTAAIAAPASPLVPAKGVALVRAWLLVIAGLVYAMILVGGATRLTDSGLSITEWRPLLGAIPPMSDADWADAFAKYQSMTAQYHAVNPGMDLAGSRRSTGGSGAIASSAASLASLSPCRSFSSGSQAARRESCCRTFSFSSSLADCRAPSAGGWSRPASTPNSLPSRLTG